jgi:anti-sigma B factor antagonist
MTHERTPVTLVQVPGALNTQQERIFLSDLESCLNASRPRIVLDCSKLRQMDKPAIHLLLCCLEEALKRNGDVKLAAIPDGASAIFALSGLGGLFEVFDTIFGAANSFQQVPKGVTLQRDVPRGSQNNPSNGT